MPRRKRVEPPTVNAVDDSIKEVLKGTQLEDVDDFRHLYRLLYPGPVPSDYRDYVTVEAVREELRYLFPTPLRKPEFEPIAKRLPLEDLSNNCIELDPLFRPASAAHFTGNPKFYNTLATMEDLLAMLNHKLSTTATKTINTSEQDMPKWLPHKDMELLLGEAFGKSLYNELIEVMSEVYCHPLYGELGQNSLQRFTSQTVDKSEHISTSLLDSKGRAHAVGKRKSSVARVWVWPETGPMATVKVNGLPLAEYFRNHDKRLAALAPLRRLDVLGQFSVMCNVHGGGVTGQADAVSLGISKGLLVLRPELKPELDRGEFLVRDSRTVEPKKAGQRKARRKFQWVKR